MTTEARDALAAALRASDYLRGATVRIGRFNGAWYERVAADILAALADGWTLARREDAEDGAALRELREALPIEHFGELFIAPKGYQMRVIRIPWGSPKEEEVHCFGGIPTIAAAARKATEALR